MASTYNVQIEDSEGNKYCPKPDLLTTQEQVNANTASGKSVDALAVKGLINNLTTSFQAGVDTLYNACVSCGVTPSAKTPAAISAAISAISTNRYNAGRTQGQNDVKGSPNSYGLYTGAQYTANYNAGYNAGVTAGQAIPRSKDFRLSLSFNDNSASAVLDTPSGGAAFISVNQSTKNSWARKNATITI